MTCNSLNPLGVMEVWGVDLDHIDTEQYMRRVKYFPWLVLLLLAVCITCVAGC